MYGRAPNKAERDHMDAVAQYGCYVCKRLGFENDHVLLHHSRGRTSKQCHYAVIPLCSEHHDYYQEGGIHNNKTRWEAKWGKQSEIVAELTAWVRGIE